MSFEPSNAPLPQPGGYSEPPAAKKSKAGLILGLLLIVAGVVGGAGLYVAQQSSYEDAVTKLQRAGSGLRTEFVFERAGTFTLYYEHAGEFTVEVGGDEEDFEIDARDEPKRVRVSLVDRDGDEIRLDRDVTDVSYDVGGFAGTSFRQVEIDDTGSYTLEVEAQDDPFAIAVGRGVLSEPNPLYPGIILIAGILLGVLAILLIGRRKPARPAAAASDAPGAGGPWAPAPPPASAPAGWEPASPPWTAGGPATPPMTTPPIPHQPPVPPPAPPRPPDGSWPPPPN